MPSTPSRGKKSGPTIPKCLASGVVVDAVMSSIAALLCTKERSTSAVSDGRLISLDATTGEKVWEVDTITDRDRYYTVTGAPRVANGKVFIGNGGAEFGVRGMSPPMMQTPVRKCGAFYCPGGSV